MVSESQARDLAVAKLRNMNVIPGDSLVIVDHLTQERSFGWIFFYDSKKFLETGEMQYAIAGNAPILVNKDDGSIVLYGSC